MEEIYPVEEQVIEQERTSQLIVNDASKNHLLNIRKWSKFMAIVSLVAIVLCTIIAIGCLFAIRSLGQEAIIVPYLLVIALLYIYPTIKAFGFVKAIKPAIENNDEAGLVQALREANSLITFFGMMMAIVLGIYALSLIFFVGAAAFL